MQNSQLGCHGHTGFWVAVLFSVVFLSANDQEPLINDRSQEMSLVHRHGHVEDSVTVAPAPGVNVSSTMSSVVNKGSVF